MFKHKDNDVYPTSCLYVFYYRISQEGANTMYVMHMEKILEMNMAAYKRKERQEKDDQPRRPHKGHPAGISLSLPDICPVLG